jgi:hypothetical protein
MSLNAKDHDSKMAFRPTETGAEILALVQTAAQRESLPSPFVFVSERGTRFTTAGFARMIERAARRGLGLELKAHPHMLRHACGYALANKGHDTRAIQGWLGHRSITSTAVYTALAPNRLRISGESEPLPTGSKMILPAKRLALSFGALRGEQRWAIANPANATIRR